MAKEKTRQAEHHQRKAETHTRVMFWMEHSELARLDKARGNKPRAAYVLEAVKEKMR